MSISILIPTYNRPHQLAEAIASIAAQDLSLVGEVLIGDDSTAEFRQANQDAVAASPIAGRIRYFANSPAKGNYPNQWFLGDSAACEYVLILHDDDHLCTDALSTLYAACASESDARVKIWFGRNLIMDEEGRVDLQRSAVHTRHYGRDGPSDVRSVAHWCLTESIPVNCFLLAKETYTQHMSGPTDSNVGDWGLAVRLANSGAWGRFVAQDISTYRVQPGSVTTAGRGMDVHRWYELAQQLKVPPEAQDAKRRRFSLVAPVATIRYARDGERLNAWRCFFSPYWTWRQRLSVRGAATALMLLTPRFVWNWALTYRD